MENNKFGLSRKANVAMVSAGCFTAVGTIGCSIDWRIGLAAIIAACVVALAAIGCQWNIDCRKNA